MKTPDKIYLNRYMIRPGMLRPAQFLADEQEFEYIRKDALLEWAKDLDECGATILALDTLIDKLNNF